MGLLISKKVEALVICGWFLCLSISAAFGPASAAEVKIKWACMGTGITAGNPSATVSYVHYLDTSLFGPQDTVLNFGASGATVLKKGDTSYWNKPQLAQLIASKPDIVSIELGTFDTKAANWQYNNDFATDLTALIDTLRSTISPSLRIWLCLPPPIYTNSAGVVDSVLTYGVIPLINQVAAARSVRIVDLNTPLRNHSSLFSGGIFPTAAGADTIALNIFRAYLNSVTRIACIGNSITHYLGTTTANTNPANSYPSKLNMLLGPDYFVKNFGVDGAYMQKSEPDNNPYWGLGKWPGIFAIKPNIVTICLGTNDSRSGDWNTNQAGTHVPNQYITDYKAFIDTLNNNISPKPTIWLCLPMPAWKYNGAWNHDHGHGGINGDIIRDSVIPSIKTVAGAKGLNTIDLWTPLSPDSIYCLYDGIHPNAAGEDTIAQVIFRTMGSSSSPSVPVLALPMNGAINQPVTLTLTWNIVSGATSYGLQISTDVGFHSTAFQQTGITANSMAGSGLGNNITYYWRANATNAAGTSNWSSIWSFTTIVLAPAIAPTLASPTNGSVNQATALTMNWGTVSGAGTYGVQVSTNTTFAATISTQTGLSTTSQIINNLSNNTTYYWHVNAANAGGTSAWSGSWSFSTCACMVLPLAASWNMKSLNIIPLDSSAATVFGTTSGFFYVKDVSGNQYCPALGADQIGHVRMGMGYQIYSNIPDTLRVQGSPIDYAATPISLNSGWCIIAYLPSANDSAWHALAGIKSSIIIVKDNRGNVYWPAIGVDNLGLMSVGEGYKVLMSAGTMLTYPAPLSLSKEIAGSGGTLLHLPPAHHYAAHANTGSNATLLAKWVAIGGEIASDGSEVAAFDTKGNLIGSGTVLHGYAAFPVWGNDPMTKQKDGAAGSEAVSFKLWDGGREYPIEYHSGTGTTSAIYLDDALFMGSLSVPAGLLISKFDLSHAYPNPFKGSVRIAFDVPTINGVSEHQISIAIFDLKGILVKQLAKGKYQAGHYELPWQCGSGSGAYIMQMKAAGFDKRMKLVRLK